MTTLTSTTGKKAVRISYNENTDYTAVHFQTGKFEQVIERKTFSTESRATKWANNQLN